MLIHYLFTPHSYIAMVTAALGQTEVSCPRTQRMLAGSSGDRTANPLIIYQSAQPPETSAFCF